MSDSPEFNNQLVLISGISGTGKSASLRNIPNQDRWLYLNTESGKRLPFKNNFMKGGFIITDPYQINEAFQYATENIPAEVDGAIIDTITFLMDMYESMYVMTSTNKQGAWSNYQQYFKNIMQNLVPNFKKPVIITAHVKDEFDERAAEIKTSVPVKGALKNNGIEAYFSTVVAAKKIQLRELKEYENSLLNITEEDELVGYKHVFQTRITKETTGERIRSPMGMFSREETYMDNDAQLLLQRLNEFYS